MPPGMPVVEPSSFGAWLIKANPRHSPVAEWTRTRFAGVTTRCVRPTYRTRLVREGQPVLLWVSGGSPEHAPGIYAVGQTTGPTRVEGASGPVLPVWLEPVEPIVPRTALLATVGLRDLEVLRMPAGSNPSWLSVDQLQTLLAVFPQVSGRTA